MWETANIFHTPEMAMQARWEKTEGQESISQLGQEDPQKDSGLVHARDPKGTQTSCGSQDGKMLHPKPAVYSLRPRCCLPTPVAKMFHKPTTTSKTEVKA